MTTKNSTKIPNKTQFIVLFALLPTPIVDATDDAVEPYVHLRAFVLLVVIAICARSRMFMVWLVVFDTERRREIENDAETEMDKQFDGAGAEELAVALTVYEESCIDTTFQLPAGRLLPELPLGFKRYQSSGCVLKRYKL